MLLTKPISIRRKGRTLWCHGNAELLNEGLRALLCSKACPGERIIEATDLAQHWRAENRAVLSGFHTAVEKECLRIFLRGPQLIVICPARGIDPFQLPSDWQTKYQRGELLIVSPFDSLVRRPTKETAEIRNKLVIDLATSVTVIHASPGGLLDQFVSARVDRVGRNPNTLVK
jgi:predicted Rossmann fold nucleotide-binding protein DprA/Smf involved in DNA uptake